MGCHFPAKRLCLFKLCVVFWNWHGLSPLLRCQTCCSPLASPFGRGAPDGVERAFLPSQSASLTAPPEWEPRGCSKLHARFKIRELPCSSPNDSGLTVITHYISAHIIIKFYICNLCQVKNRNIKCRQRIYSITV